MKGLRKVIPRAVNPNPRVCPMPLDKITKRIVPTTPPRLVEPLVEGALPDFEEKVEDKKSTKTQTTHKTSKWNK